MVSSFPTSLPPHVPSTLHVTASDISLFASTVEENDAPEFEQLAVRALASEEQMGGKKNNTLGLELLEALRLGKSNFLLAYNTRAGIAVLLRLLKFLQRRDWKAAANLPQLLDEKYLNFRVDAVRLGLFLGWFTGGYKGLKALLPLLLRRIVPIKQLRDEGELKKIAASGSGAIAALALGFMDPKRRRSFALYALTRALQCGYNTAKRQKRWHFWGSDWQYGDALLFALSCAQVMYAYIMRPSTLPSDYFDFIQRTGPVEPETLEMVHNVNRGDPVSAATFQKLMDRKPGIPRALPLPTDIVSCRLVHANADSCLVGALLCFKRAFQKTFPLYLSLFIVPNMVIHFERFLRKPFETLAQSTFGAIRSNCFLASYVTLYLSLVCLHRRVVSADHRFFYYLAGFGASITILLEPKSRRSGIFAFCQKDVKLIRNLALLCTELALYVLPRAIDSLAMILQDRQVCFGFKYAEVVLFSASMSVMMYCYEEEMESMSPLLYNTMKRFLQTSTDKKINT
ncbi:hypothetical protein CCR75_006690 [Bremia lactucae]|uniref:Transmembrane protein 135 N-terminal domain-containing protein n=1 Tax=Bremia lactucae TaxID=4779 RepID=A0A976NZW3_BRELC|nr:hypothetical protein CCR75_006690 [Bremia lactucae]